MSSLLPLNSSTKEHAIDLVAEKKLDIDFAPVNFDPLTCDTKFLPFLAYENRVNIDGLTEQQSRTLIKNAPEIHEYEGTIFAVETALLSMFSSAEVVNQNQTPERVWEFDAQVNLPTDANVTFTARSFTIARRLVNDAKNGHTRFINFDIGMPDIETTIFDTTATTLAIDFSSELQMHGNVQSCIQTAIKWDLNIGDYNE